MGKVEVSKGLLIGLGATYAAMLLAVAFLLGRQTARPLAGPVPAAPAPVVAPPVATDAPQAAPQAAVSPVSAAPAASPAPVPSTLPAPAPVERAGIDPARAAVAAYFAAIDRIQPDKLGGDSEALAQEIVGALAKGDTSGLDAMVKQTTAARDSLRALTPPAPCAAHHRDCLAIVDEGLQLIRTLKQAMQPGGQQGDLTGQANALKARTESLQRQEQALRQRYGLTR